MLALICLPLAWKLLSLDFTGLGDLCSRPPVFNFYPQFVKAWLVENRCLFFSGNRTRYIQILAALLLVGAVVRPTRFLLIPGIVLVWLLDTGAALFRFNFFTIDTPLALLVLVAICPVRLPAASGMSAQPSADARIVFMICFSYVATFYVLAGLSKIVFDWRWPFIVKVGNYYPISYLWHGQTMPEPINTIARISSEAMLKSPWLDYASSMLVLVEQFFWLAAPFGILLRFHAGLFSAAYHVIVMLTTGIAFITWIPIALAVSVPFSSVARWWQSRKAGVVLLSNSGGGRPVALGFVALLGIFAASFPSRGTVVPPFYKYLAFGWRYPEIAEMKVFYRIGFRNPKTEQLDSLPLHHAGFLDFMHVGYLDVSARYAFEQKENPAVKAHFSDAIRSLLSVLRPADANGWLLGNFRAPAHLLSVPGDTRISELRRFFILEGTPAPGPPGHPYVATWRICGEVDLDQSETSKAVTLYEQCK